MKTIVYRFNGDSTSEEQEVDIDDEASKLSKGTVIERKGNRWRVSEIMTQTGVSAPKPIDVVRVFLVGPI